MSTRPVILSVEDEHGERCVDFIAHGDGTYVFRLCRKDPEDHSRWSIVADYSGMVCPDLESAYTAARNRIPWLPETTSCPAKPPAPRSSA